MAKYQQAATAVLADEQGSKWELIYYVQIFDDASTGLITYGIKIERCCHGKNQKNNQEKIQLNSEETLGLTHSYEEAQSWAQKLANGAVTPVCLHDVIDDLM